MKSILLNFLLEPHIGFFTDYQKRILKYYVTCPQKEMIEERYGDTLQQIESQLLGHFCVDFEEPCSVQYAVRVMCEEFSYEDIIQYLDNNDYLSWLSIREGLFLGILNNREQRSWRGVFLTSQEYTILTHMMSYDTEQWMRLEYTWILSQEPFLKTRWIATLWENSIYLVLYITCAGLVYYRFFS